MGTKGLGDNQAGLVGVVEVSGIEPLTSCMPSNYIFSYKFLIHKANSIGWANSIPEFDRLTQGLAPL